MASCPYEEAAELACIPEDVRSDVIERVRSESEEALVSMLAELLNTDYLLRYTSECDFLLAHFGTLFKPKI